MCASQNGRIISSDDSHDYLGRCLKSAPGPKIIKPMTIPPSYWSYIIDNHGSTGAQNASMFPIFQQYIRAHYNLDDNVPEKVDHEYRVDGKPVYFIFRTVRVEKMVTWGELIDAITALQSATIDGLENQNDGLTFVSPGEMRDIDEQIDGEGDGPAVIDCLGGAPCFRFAYANDLGW